MRGVPIGSPSRSGCALRLGAMIRPTALRSFLPKPESETSLSSVVTFAGGDTKDPYCRYTSFVTSAEEVIRRIHIANTRRLRPPQEVRRIIAPSRRSYSPERLGGQDVAH